MQPKKRSPLAAIVLAVVIGLLVIALLNGVIRPTQVVVAKVSIAPGTILTDSLVELRTIPAGLMNFVQKYDIDWGQMSAAAVVTLIPVVILFFTVQKYIVAGLTAGSVKE